MKVMCFHKEFISLQHRPTKRAWWRLVLANLDLCRHPLTYPACLRDENFRRERKAIIDSVLLPRLHFFLPLMQVSMVYPYQNWQ
jgi:hypothetical protein